MSEELTTDEEVQLLLYDAKEKGDMFKLYLTFEGCPKCKSTSVQHLIRLPEVTENEKAHFYLVCAQCDEILVKFWEMEKELWEKHDKYMQKWSNATESRKKGFIALHSEKAKQYMKKILEEAKM
jgi:hypothetical protein